MLCGTWLHTEQEVCLGGTGSRLTAEVGPADWLFMGLRLPWLLYPLVFYIFCPPFAPYSLGDRTFVGEGSKKAGRLGERYLDSGAVQRKKEDGKGF